MNVHFQCVVQVCRGSCPNPQCGGGGGGGGGGQPSYGGGGGGGFSSGSSTSSVTSQPAGDGYGSPQAPAVDR